MDWTNEDRAKRGEQVRAFLVDLYEDEEAFLQDALADLMHAGLTETDLERAVRLAQMHFEEEHEEVKS